jgi:N-acetylglucosaminyldiphosphoundecaprenol N-acetyl-beta-D-mannosaminyltransferase
MPRVCEKGVALNLRHFLLGSTSQVLDQLQANLERHHPGIAIVGSYSPSRSEIEGDVQGLVSRVGSSDPHIVWCAFGAPRQEIWMARAAPQLSSSLLVGVGAAFDFIAGTKPRAHPWLQRAGFEWAHRLSTEPKRLIGRYLRTNCEFVLRAAAQLLRRGR